MPQLTSFQFEIVEEVLSEHGIHVIEEFSDGQKMWGNEPISLPYRGDFHMADFYFDDRYDVITIQTITNRLGKAGKWPEIHDALLARTDPNPGITH